MKYIISLDKHHLYQENVGQYLSDLESRLTDSIFSIKKVNCDLSRGLYRLQVFWKDNQVNYKPQSLWGDRNMFTLSENEELAKIETFLEKIRKKDVTREFHLSRFLNHGVITHFSFENLSQFPNIEKDIMVSISSYSDKFVVKFIYNFTTTGKFHLWKKTVELRPNETGNIIDAFEINMFFLEEMVANKNKGMGYAMGEFCFVDNDLLLGELVKIYQAKMEIDTESLLAKILRPE